MADHSQRFVSLVKDAKQRIEEITPKEVEEKRDDPDDDFALIDIREREEWENAHIHDAQLIPRGILERDIEDEIPDTEREIVLYCGGGYRSALAADNLQKMGYQNVKSMKGGFRSWQEAGLPIVKGDKG